MAMTMPDQAFTTSPAKAAAVPTHTTRDPRLDFFRGIAMFIILLAHTPGNDWTRWIPARWGFSDATEMFVFCSGMASAIAFGGSFDRGGWAMGTARVGYRVWQIYWAHIGMFFAIAAMLAAIDATGWHEKVYINTLNLTPFFNGVERGGEIISTTANQLLGLATLTYVPNYFDILPMYMVVLAMMPVVMLLARVSVSLLALCSLTVWVFAQEAFLEWLGLGHLHLAFPAEPWSAREWFFNPFGWQLLFFTGFGFMRGWIPAPVDYTYLHLSGQARPVEIPVRRILTYVSLSIVIASFFLSSVGFRLFQTDLVRDAYIALTGCAETGFGRCNPVFDWRQANKGWYNKSDFGPLHFIHFLALAYLAWSLAGDGGSRLIAKGQGTMSRLWDGLVGIVMKVGQQSLAVFIFSMVLARFNGYVIDVIGESAANWALINLAGFGLLVACAYVAGWFKSQPWRRKRG